MRYKISISIKSCSFSQMYVSFSICSLSFFLPLCFKSLPPTAPFTFLSLNNFFPQALRALTIMSVFFPYVLLIAREFVAKVKYLFLETCEPNLRKSKKWMLPGSKEITVISSWNLSNMMTALPIRKSLFHGNTSLESI